MKIINCKNTISFPTALTIGSFDGVHMGHKDLLMQMKAEADKKGLKTAVMTFVPHPKIYFNPDTNHKLLNILEYKTKLLEKTGIDYLILQDFTNEFSEQSAETLISNLQKKFKMKLLFMGYDNHFGKNRKGGFDYIKSLEKKYNFKAKKIEPFKLENIIVSSSYIRELISEGNVKKANKFLGYDFSISGKVVYGNKIGNKIGFPTANIKVNNRYKLTPKQGVYIVYSIIDNKKYYGMMNIGVRPTVDGTRMINEVHFFDFTKYIYDKELSIYFLKRLRNEKKFTSLESLKEQLISDKKKSLEWIKKY